MLYIRCTQCGYNNPVKSETILFCENCSKKLQNNFKDWHKIHPEKTFDDFSKQYCISEFDLAVQNLETKSRKGTNKVLLIVAGAVLAILVILGLTGYFVAKKYLDKNLKTQTPQTLLASSWKEFQVGKSALYLHLPFSLTKQEIPLPETAENLIDTMESYAHLSDNGFKVMVSIAKYKEGIEANLEGAVAGSIGEIQKMQGISEFKWNREDTVVGSLKGTMSIVNFKLLTYPMEVKLLTVCDRNILYQIFTQYSKDDETGKKASEKIISSANIKGN